MRLADVLREIELPGKNEEALPASRYFALARDLARRLDVAVKALKKHPCHDPYFFAGKVFYCRWCAVLKKIEGPEL